MTSLNGPDPGTEFGHYLTLIFRYKFLALYLNIYGIQKADVNTLVQSSHETVPLENFFGRSAEKSFRMNLSILGIFTYPSFQLLVYFGAPEKLSPACVLR